MLARQDVPIEVRRQTLNAVTPAPADQARLLMQLTKIQILDPDRTAEAIAPLLLELPNEAVLAINKELDELLDSRTAGLRSAAVALKVRSGAPLGALAERDPTALLSAIDSLSKDQATGNLAATLIDLAKDGQLDAGQAIQQANRLSSDKAALFDRLAELAGPAMSQSYAEWGQPHTLAMAALAGMHETPDEDWPDGFDQYRIARAEQSVLELGKERYFHHEKGCVKCHGEHGEGTAGFPPLAQSPMVNGDPVRAATIVKYGLMGELAHTLNPADGKPFSAQMEPLSYYNNAEIAAAVTFVRQSFGNFSAPVTIDDVAAAKSPAEGLMWNASDLLAKYPFERDRISGSLPPPSVEVKTWTPPSSGLALMLIVVTLCMLLILGGTYAGKYFQPLQPAH